MSYGSKEKDVSPPPTPHGAETGPKPPTGPPPCTTTSRWKRRAEGRWGEDEGGGEVGTSLLGATNIPQQRHHLVSPWVREVQRSEDEGIENVAEAFANDEGRTGQGSPPNSPVSCPAPERAFSARPQCVGLTGDFCLLACGGCLVGLRELLLDPPSRARKKSQ